MVLVSLFPALSSLCCYAYFLSFWFLRLLLMNVPIVASLSCAGAPMVQASVTAVVVPARRWTRFGSRGVLPKAPSHLSGSVFSLLFFLIPTGLYVTGGCKAHLQLLHAPQ